MASMQFQESRESRARRALIFDLDGTLFDTAGDLAAGMNAALSHLGLQRVDAGEVRNLVGHGARAMLKRGILLSSGEQIEDGSVLEDAHRVFLDYYHCNIGVHTLPFPGVIEMITAYRQQGVVIGICTNKREGSARQLVDALGYADLFDALVGGDSAHAAKPDHAPVQMTLDRLSVRHAIFIGDSDTDIGAAASMGLPALIATFGYGPVTRISETVGLFDDYDTCRRLIDAYWVG